LDIDESGADSYYETRSCKGKLISCQKLIGEKVMSRIF